MKVNPQWLYLWPLREQLRYQCTARTSSVGLKFKVMARKGTSHCNSRCCTEALKPLAIRVTNSMFLRLTAHQNGQANALEEELGVL